MIKDKLNKLGDCVDEIYKLKSIELLGVNIIKIEEDLKNLPKEQVDLGYNFRKDISNMIKDSKNKGTCNPVIIYELYNILIDSLRKSVIEERAEQLGIDKKMYKEEMRLLFKGKKNLNH
jgi:hypothetical protein